MGGLIIPFALLLIGPLSSSLRRALIISAAAAVCVDIASAIAFQSFRPLTANGQMWALGASQGDVFLVWIWNSLAHAGGAAGLGAAGYGIKRVFKPRPTIA